VAYLPRIVDAELDARLLAAGAVVIEGPKASGKTETARQRAASSPRDVAGKSSPRMRRASLSTAGSVKANDLFL